MRQSVSVPGCSSHRLQLLAAALLAAGISAAGCSQIAAGRFDKLKAPSLSRGTASQPYPDPGRVAAPRRPGSTAAISPRGWGVDAGLTGFVAEADRPAYVDLLRDSGVGFLRERGPSPALAPLQQAGFRVASFLGLHGVSPQIAGNQLPEDLLAVYRAAAALAREYPSVDAWEMVGEPDVGYARDLPDRVAAFQKAVYLGIHSAMRRRAEGGGLMTDGRNQTSVIGPQSSESADQPSVLRPPSSATIRPVVLMGALALPPGPWLERAARNGLLDYTDAYNFHFYSRAEELTGVIDAHRAFMNGWRMAEDGLPVRPAQGTMAAKLPLWITEAGFNAVVPGDLLNPQRRKMQADFTVSTARQALAAPDVAMFMPFILVHEGDSFALTVTRSQSDLAGARVQGAGGQKAQDEGPTAEAGSRPAVIRALPAWDAYAKFTREHPWPARPLGRPPHDPNPVVVQWLPAPGSGVPHKVSGTYRFRNGLPIVGEIRIYNLGDVAVQGRLEVSDLDTVLVDGLAPAEGGRLGAPEVTIAPLAMVSYPVMLFPLANGYFRSDWEPVFTERSGRRSEVFLGLEAWPVAGDFQEVPLALSAANRGQPQYPQFASYRAGERAGVWTTMNGLRGESLPGEGAGAGSAARFWTEKAENDPLQPPMAVAQIKGLPAAGFIRLHLSRPMDQGTQVRLDLVDQDGQRFTIWENFGRSYFERSPDVWLNLRDFGVYFWGKTKPDPRFHPERVREIQLRFYLAQAGNPVDLSVSLLRAIAGRR